MTHICVSKLTIIGSDNGLSPDRRQAIICTNAGLLLIGPLGRNFSEILIEILTFSFKKMRLKVSSAKRRPFCLDLNVLRVLSIQQYRRTIASFKFPRYYLNCVWTQNTCFNSLKPRQNRHHFADDIFKCIFLNENVWISIKISLKFVPKGPINNIPALVQAITWTNDGYFTDAYLRHSASMS